MELKEKCIFVCMDDKAKIPVGDPELPVSTGVRGKKSIVPVATVLSAADHDMNKANLTPSVILKCEIPDSVEKSFGRGQAVTCVNDSVFQPSDSFRHAAMLVKFVKNDPQ